MAVLELGSGCAFLGFVFIAVVLGSSKGLGSFSPENRANGWQELKHLPSAQRLSGGQQVAFEDLKMDGVTCSVWYLRFLPAILG